MTAAGFKDTVVAIEHPIVYTSRLDRPNPTRACPVARRRSLGAAAALKSVLSPPPGYPGCFRERMLPSQHSDYGETAVG
jgi:hypothetical protein